MAAIKNGLYVITIEMKEGGRGFATGVIILNDGRIFGGDCNFYHTGSYVFKNGKWRGEITSHQHTDAPGVQLLFGGREVSCGFTGTYSDGMADVDGTALVGRNSVWFVAGLAFKAPL